jgi:DNA-binding MarR family transcriptional regulator
MNTTSRLINLFFMTHRSLHKHMQESKVITSFSFLQFLTMKFVREEGQVRMKDIARFLSITPASATSLINGLVDMGSLERIADKKDRRIIRLRATAGGRKKLKGSEDQAKKELRRIFMKLSVRDRDDLLHILEKLSGILMQRKSLRVPNKAL